MIKSNCTLSAVIVFLTTLLLSVLPPHSHAQWGYNGYQIPYLINATDIVPGPDNSVWVLQGLLAGPEYSVSYLQRYDEDGYPMFEQPGIRATEMDVISDPMGILPTSDGGVILGFVASMDEEYGNSIYGQRYSADGEKLWGPDGAPAILTHLLADNYPNYPTICSDGNDGFWCYFFDSPNTPIYVCGLNSDGSMKVDEPILIREDLWPSGDIITIAEGDSGGMYIAFITSRYDDITNIQHVNADGSLRWEDPPTLYDGPLSRKTYIMKALDNHFYLVTPGINIFYFNSDADMQWDDRLTFRFGANTQNSSPVVFPDGSIGLVGTGNNTVFIRVRPDGTSYYDDGYRINLHHYYNDGFIYFKSLNLSNDNLFLYCTFIHQYYNAITSNRTQKIDTNDGHECWQDSVFVCSPYHGILGSLSTVTTNNELVIVAIESSFNCFLFKVHEDGSVAGRTDDVPESPSDIEQPTSFSLLALYPNPFNHQIILELEIQQAEAISITLYNLLGESIYQRQPSIEMGFNRLSLNMEEIGLASGTYFITIAGPKEKLTRKVEYVH